MKVHESSSTHLGLYKDLSVSHDMNVELPCFSYIATGLRRCLHSNFISIWHVDDLILPFRLSDANSTFAKKTLNSDNQYHICKLQIRKSMSKSIKCLVKVKIIERVYFKKQTDLDQFLFLF